MKNILLAIVLILLTTSGSAKTTKITGHFLNSEKMPLQVGFVLTDQLNRSNLSTRQTLSTINGKFEITIDISSNCTFGIDINDRNFFGPMLNMALIEPGDSLHFEIKDCNSLDVRTFICSGIGSEKFSLYKKMFAQLSIPLSKYKHPWEKNAVYPIKECLEVSRAYDSVLSTNNALLRGPIGKLIRANCEYGFFDALFVKLLDSQSVNPKYSELFTNEIVKSNIIEHFTEGATVYTLPATHVLNNYALLNFYYKTKDKVNDGIRWTEPLKFYKIISEFYKNKPILKEFLLAEFLDKYVHVVGATPELNNLYLLFLKDVDKKSPFFVQISNIIISSNKLSVGVPFLNFSLQDENGRYVRLSDFKGKVVVLDFFFLGCAGCRASIPILQKVEKTFNEQQVVFISVSIDSFKDWHKSRGIYSNANSIQLITNGERSNNELVKYGQVASYPTVLVIDKQGKFVCKATRVLGDDGKNLTENIQSALEK